MLEAVNLNAGYSRKPAIKNINARFDLSNICAIIGSNGSGKSTLLKSFCGILKPQEGNIKLDGEDINNIKIKDLYKKIAYLPQNMSEYNIILEEFILRARFPQALFPAIYSENDKAIALKSIAKFNLLELREKKLSQLSGGELRRAYLAQLDAQDCDYIFMDEPASFLDISSKLLVLSYIKELRNLNKSVIIISHDINEAINFADKIIVLKNGSIINKFNREQFFSDDFSDTIANAFEINANFNNKVLLFS